MNAITVGVEEELQIVDPDTRELMSAASRLTALAEAELAPKLRMEVHQGVIEIVTGVCEDIATLRADLRANRVAVRALAARAGLAIAAAGAHPFSDWRTQTITDGARFAWITQETGEHAMGLFVFGLHVHVGIPDADEAIGVMNRLRAILPHLLALTTSSPLWLGRLAGQESVRAHMRRWLPRTGIPDAFASWAHYRQHVDLLLRTGCIDMERRLWWDLRRSPSYPTIEFRISDMPTRVEDTVAVAALIQALVGWALDEHRAATPFVSSPSAFLEENRRRAARGGVRCSLADFERAREVPFADALEELLARVEPAARALGTADEVAAVRRIVRDGTSAERQRTVYAATEDPRAVVDWLLAETARDLSG